MRWRAGALGMAWLGVCLVAGCLGGGAKPEYFTLSAAANAPAAPLPGVRPDLGIAIGPIELPRYLDRPEIVTRDGSHRLVMWSDHRWGGSLRTDILRAMAEDIGALLGTARLAVYPTEPRFPVDFRVLLELLEFEGVPGGEVTLRARWTVASGADGRALAVEEARVTEATASPSWGHLVAAQRAALGRLTRQIAERIAALARP